MAATSRVVTESMVQQTCDILRERIRTGDLAPGARLRQEQLADELGVSRTPLREALRLLAADGLVELVPNRGAVVTTLSHEDRVAFWEARLALEPAAARLAAERRDATGLAAMRRAIADQRGAADDERGFAANRAFHLALVETAGNEHLERFAETLWVRAVGSSIYRSQVGDGGGTPVAFIAEHEAILAAIEAGDCDHAEALTRAHILAAPVPAA